MLDQTAPATPQQPAPLLDVDAVRSRFKLGKSTLARLVASNRFPQPLKIGGSVRWRAEVLDAWLADGCPRDVRAWEARRQAKRGQANR